MASASGGKRLWHVLGIVVSVLWGTTFVSSKVLLTEGMTPAEIMGIRFALAYVCILPFSLGGRRRGEGGSRHRRGVAAAHDAIGEALSVDGEELPGGGGEASPGMGGSPMPGMGAAASPAMGGRSSPGKGVATSPDGAASRKGLWASVRGLLADNVWDELLFVVAGLSGGSLYFLCENTALIYSQASNVSILIATTPLLTALLSAALVKDGQVTPRTVAYSLVALLGVVTVVLNGEFVLDLHPLGDVLTFAAVLLWVLYSMVVRRLDEDYPAAMLTRKVFFYGAATMLPCFLWQPWGASLAVLCRPVVLLNLFFLGFIASFLCYYAWNRVLAEIGPVSANNYLYLNPLATAILAVPLLGERFTWMSALGSVLIIAGMYLAGRRH